MQIETKRLLGKTLGLEPAIDAQGKVTDARLQVELATLLEPVIEPTQQQRIRIEQCLGAEVLFPDQFAPRDVDPRTRNQVLVFRLRSQGKKTGDTARQVGIELA